MKLILVAIFRVVENNRLFPIISKQNKINQFFMLMDLDFN